MRTTSAHSNLETLEWVADKLFISSQVRETPWRRGEKKKGRASSEESQDHRLSFKYMHMRSIYTNVFILYGVLRVRSSEGRSASKRVGHSWSPKKRRRTYFVSPLHFQRRYRWREREDLWGEKERKKKFSWAHTVIWQVRPVRVCSVARS